MKPYFSAYTPYFWLVRSKRTIRTLLKHSYGPCKHMQFSLLTAIIIIIIITDKSNHSQATNKAAATTDMHQICSRFILSPADGYKVQGADCTDLNKCSTLCPCVQSPPPPHLSISCFLSYLYQSLN